MPQLILCGLSLEKGQGSNILCNILKRLGSTLDVHIVLYTCGTFSAFKVHRPLSKNWAVMPRTFLLLLKGSVFVILVRTCMWFHRNHEQRQYTWYGSWTLMIWSHFTWKRDILIWYFKVFAMISWLLFFANPQKSSIWNWLSKVQLSTLVDFTPL